MLMTCVAPDSDSIKALLYTRRMMTCVTSSVRKRAARSRDGIGNPLQHRIGTQQHRIGTHLSTRVAGPLARAKGVLWFFSLALMHRICDAQTCSAGTSGVWPSCSVCAANTYSSAGAAACTACPSNTWSAAGAASCFNNSYPIFAIISDNQGAYCTGDTAPCGRYINLQTNAVSNINTGFNGYGTPSLDGSYAILVDANDNVIKKLIFSTGTATTIAGSSTAGWVDGIGTNAHFNYPWDAAISPDNSYALIADC